MTLNKIITTSITSIGCCLILGCSTRSVPTPPIMSGGQLTFDNPVEAVNSLELAVKDENAEQLLKIFGPNSKDIINSGDPIADKNKAKLFSNKMDSGAEIVQFENKNPAKRGQDLAVLLVGQDSWPFPIAMVRENERWRFDTEVGKEEIINRRIGENELSVIAACAEYVAAQHEYAAIPKGSPASSQFAQKFFSTPGKQDGLYWEVKSGETLSPMGPYFAIAALEGYSKNKASTKPQPFHGYYFKILTSQGKNARGGAMNYIQNGKMTGGFALLAYPAEWDISGAMTFIVGPDGVIYQKNLGAKTSQLAAKITTFDPDKTWNPA